MLQETVIYAADATYPFSIVAKRYWTPACQRNAFDPDALTLIFLHSTSFHKEIWEPTLQHLFDLVANSSIRIREAWALDCPNHGEAAALNEEVLQKAEYRQSFTCEKYAQAVHRFLSDGPKHDARTDFFSRKLVGIGHSLGAVAMSALQAITPTLPFSSIVIVEPMLSPDGRHHLDRLRQVLVASASERRDVWPDREAAKKYLQERMNRPGRVPWDPRVIEVFVKHGLRQHPVTALEASYQGVSLACTRDEEVGMYLDVDGPTLPVSALTEACSRIPVHIAFGTIIDFIPRKVREATIDPQSGRKFASISYIEGVGHLVPQAVPEKLAHFIFKTFKYNQARDVSPKGKL
ncbi:hypothetical protein ONZ45_g9309 [Pleurotus djamor]|nr:hypothetical protein ONZ45_g9309 [Pleurotus djamor]